MNDNRIEVLRKGDAAFPEFLAEMPNGPDKLYCIGDVSLLKRKAAAVVGARECSEYGRSVAVKLGKLLADNGIVTVSGLAAGIDSMAHAGALSRGGATIAVLGTGPDICYPRENANVYRQICSGGLVVSEYEPGTTARPWHFPARNRIISAISEAVVVVEAGEKSGALITASCAAEQGKEVLAVPGSIASRYSRGTNCLIRDGACIVTCPGDVLAALGIEQGLPDFPAAVPSGPRRAATGTATDGPRRAAARAAQAAPGAASRRASEGGPRTAPTRTAAGRCAPAAGGSLPQGGLGGRERRIWDVLEREGCITVEALCEATGLSPVEVNAAIAVMELEGLVRYGSGKIFIANF